VALPVCAGLSLITAGGGALALEWRRQVAVERTRHILRGTRQLPVYPGFLSGAVYAIENFATWWWCGWMLAFAPLIALSGYFQLRVLEDEGLVEEAAKFRGSLLVAPSLAGVAGLLMGLGSVANKAGPWVGFAVHWPLASCFQGCTFVYCAANIPLATTLYGMGGLFIVRVLLVSLGGLGLLGMMLLLGPAMKATQTLWEVDAVATSDKYMHEEEAGSNSTGKSIPTLPENRDEVEAMILTLRRMVFRASFCQMCIGFSLGLAICSGAAESLAEA